MLRLICGDALEEMDKLIKESVKVDAIITDPPYNISKKNNFPTMLNKYGRQANRTGIDFGEWDKGFDLYGWLDVAYKLIRSGGTLFFFNSWKNIGEMAKYAEKLGFEAKDMFRWEKTNPMPRNRDRRYIVDFELGVWAVKGKKWTFNRLDPKFQRPKYVGSTVSSNRLHPTQKPVELMEMIIRIHTNKGDLVLDPFVGSGTTGVACKNLNRDFIGIELDKKYFKIAKRRINDA